MEVNDFKTPCRCHKRNGKGFDVLVDLLKARYEKNSFLLKIIRVIRNLDKLFVKYKNI